MIAQKTLQLAKNLVFNKNNFQFGMKTTAQSVLYGKKPDLGLDEVYTREYFELRSENPDIERVRREIAEKQLQQQKEQYFFEKKTNDTNQQNIIPVQVNSQFIGKTAKIREKRQFNLQTENQDKTQLSAHPFVILHKPREPKLTVSGIRRNIPTTLKKLRYSMKVIRNKQVFDAITILHAIGKKASRYVLLALKQVIRHAQQKDMDINRLYVNGAMMGKQRRFKLLYYKAKSAMGIMKKDICQVKITLEEKPIKEMYKEVLVGKAPPALAYLLRQQLEQSQADLETIQKWSHVLTAKGRQQRRLMFKRRVIQKQQEYLRYGVQVEKKVIAARLLEVEASEWANDYESKRLELDQESINKRMAIYKKNEQITGFN